jgi:hypothetical protein
LPPDGEALHIFENEEPRAQFADKPYELAREPVPRVIERPLANHAKSLARRPSNNNGDIRIAYWGMRTNVIAIYIRNATADDRTLRKVELVSCAVDWVVFNGGKHREPGLLEAEAQAACARE